MRELIGLWEGTDRWCALELYVRRKEQPCATREKGGVIQGAASEP